MKLRGGELAVDDDKTMTDIVVRRAMSWEKFGWKSR